MGKEQQMLVAVNASVLIAREGHTPVIKMSHVPMSFYAVHVYTVPFACILDLSYTSGVTKVSVPINIIIIIHNSKPVVKPAAGRADQAFLEMVELHKEGSRLARRYAPVMHSR
jgi:hypothetical protein